MVTAVLAAPVQAHLNALRTAYFPPERNYLDAHLTLFHAVPAAVTEQLGALLAQATASLPLPVALKPLKSLGRGFAVPIEAPELVAMHNTWRRTLKAHLTAQDMQGLWPHVTLQNKVAPQQAKEDLVRARAQFVVQKSEVVAFAVFRYDGGPWSFEREFARRSA